MTEQTITIKASELQPGDLLKTSDGWVKTGGTQPLSGDRVGIYTPAGLLPVPEHANITVRREVTK